MNSITGILSIVITAMGVVILGMFFYISKLNSTIENLKTENTVCRTGLRTSEASVKELESALEKLNSAIADFKKAAQKKEAENKEKLAQAKREADKYRKLADDLMNAQPQSGNSCNDANSLINRELLREQK